MGALNNPKTKSSRDRVRAREYRRGLQAAQLIPPVCVPASPFGGNGPPSSSWYIPVIEGSFGVQASRPWIISLDRIVRTGFAVDLPWITDASTTGEIRLHMAGFSTDVIVLPAGDAGTAVFRWNHPLQPWLNDFIWVYVETRRTSGAGNVHIGYPPGGGRQVDPTGCTGNGL